MIGMWRPCANSDCCSSMPLRPGICKSVIRQEVSSYLDDTSCLITDLQMPGLNGIELQQSLLAQGRHIPIIFVTAFPEERMRARAIEDGAPGFLGKPAVSY